MAPSHPITKEQIIKFKLTEVKPNDDILTRAGRNDGMQVPDGYFKDFAARMAAVLPERPELEQSAQEAQRLSMPRTPWQKIRPYVYMAAMFAGVWCMLKVFASFNHVADPLAIESYPELAEALGSDQFVRDYVYDDIDTYDIYDQIAESGIDVAALMAADSLAEAQAYEALGGPDGEPRQPILNLP